MDAYQSTLDFLYNRLQSFHNQGATAYKPGLEKAYALAAAFGNPHTAFRSVHVGGTNGKGSTAHSIASVLMAAGLKVGLYTSPHLVDFRERIRINGEMISRDEVVDFVERFRAMNLTDTDPSFFELTTIMAFEHFARNKVDVAVIEVGLGGRLDTTNIITPELSVVTNISFDHTGLLGDTLAKIAGEKAGIIKSGIPVVVGRRDAETDPVFANRAAEVGAPLTFAEDADAYTAFTRADDVITYHSTQWGDVSSCLIGDCQPENARTILTALDVLDKRLGLNLTRDMVDAGLRKVCTATGLAGRWMVLGRRPLVVADTAHNVDGLRFVCDRLSTYAPEKLHIVLGFVSDKDYAGVLSMMPKDARYYIVSPSVDRRADAEAVLQAAKDCGLQNSAAYPSVMAGYNQALAEARQSDPEGSMVYVGGSTFVVADLLTGLQD